MRSAINVQVLRATGRFVKRQASKRNGEKTVSTLFRPRFVGWKTRGSLQGIQTAGLLGHSCLGISPQLGIIDNNPWNTIQCNRVVGQHVRYYLTLPELLYPTESQATLLGPGGDAFCIPFLWINITYALRTVL